MQALKRNYWDGMMAKRWAAGALAFGLALATASAAEEGSWLTSLPAAQQEAKAQHKYVFMDFNGSDWCPPCKQLRKNVLNSKEFQAFAGTNLVLVDVDFPISKKQPADIKAANEALRDKYNIEGYPTTILLSPDGKEISRSLGYEGASPTEFINTLKEAEKKAGA